MKVCFLVSNLISGGVERTVCYISKYFAHHGVDTTILSLSDEIFYNVDEKVRLISLHIDRGYNNYFEKYSRIIRRMNGVKKHINSEKYDVVFCMAPEMSRYILPLHKKGTFKLISSERNNPLFDNARDKKIKEKLFPKCDGIIFQTERAMKCFASEIQKRGVVIPNAVGNELAYEIVAPTEKEKKFSAVGRLTKQKDYSTMINAFAVFCKKHSGYVLDIYGKGEDKEELERLAHQLGIESQVHFKGVSQEALREIADSTAFLLSSIYEGIPNVLLEAMAIGMPCVSTDCPFGPKELIENKINGLLVPCGDVTGFADAMCQVVENPSASNEMGMNAKRVKKDYSIDTIAQKYLEYIQYVGKEK